MIIFTQNFCVFMIARQSVKTFSKKKIAIVTLAEGEMRQYNENKRERGKESWTYGLSKGIENKGRIWRTLDERKRMVKVEEKEEKVERHTWARVTYCSHLRRALGAFSAILWWCTRRYTRLYYPVYACRRLTSYVRACRLAYTMWCAKSAPHILVLCIRETRCSNLPIIKRLVSYSTKGVKEQVDFLILSFSLSFRYVCPSLVCYSRRFLFLYLIYSFLFLAMRFYFNQRLFRSASIF